MKKPEIILPIIAFIIAAVAGYIPVLINPTEFGSPQSQLNVFYLAIIVSGVTFILTSLTKLNRRFSDLRNEQLKFINSKIYKALEAFDPVQRQQVEDELVRISNSLVGLKPYPNLQQFEIRRLSGYASDFENTFKNKTALIDRPLRRIHERETFDFLVNELLPIGSEYCTVSNFRFWSPELMNSPEGFLHGNIAASENKGISFFRVILVHNHFDKLEKSEKIILQEHAKKVTKNPMFNTRIAYIKDDIYINKHFALCMAPDGSVFVVRVRYVPDESTNPRKDALQYRYNGLLFSAFSKGDKKLSNHKMNFISTFNRFYNMESISIQDYMEMKYTPRMNLEGAFEDIYNVPANAKFPKPKRV